MARGSAVIRYEGSRGAVWRIKFRGTAGKQVMETLGREADGWTGPRPSGRSVPGRPRSRRPVGGRRKNSSSARSRNGSRASSSPLATLKRTNERRLQQHPSHPLDPVLRPAGARLDRSARP